MVGVGKRVIAAGPGTHGLKDGALALPVEKISCGNAVAVAINFRPDNHKLVWIGVGHGGEKSGVDDAENGGVGADSKNERKKGHGGETGVFEEQPEAKANVARKVSHTGSPNNAG